MHRYAKALIVILAAMALGACAEKIRVAAEPILPAAHVIEVTPEPPMDEVAELPIMELRLAQLAGQVTVINDTEHCDVAAFVLQTATDRELASASLRVDAKAHQYVEVRSNVLKPEADHIKEIALRVLDTETCTTQIIKVTKTYGTRTINVPTKTKSGTVWKMQPKTVALLEVPVGWDIDVIHRVNDLQWNNWGTQFHINAPTDHIVVGVKYPLVTGKDSKGRPKVTYLPYVPYSEPLAMPAIIRIGPAYIDQQEQRVKDTLRSRKVMSQAFPGMLVADAMDRYPKAYPLKYLLPIEHMDEGEFFLDPKWTTDRVYVVIGANRELFATYTCSPVKACGPQQFMPASYRWVRDTFPAAKLMRDVDQGRRDGFNSMVAAALLLDLQLEVLKNMLGSAIVDDPNVDELQVAGYNTGAGRSGKVYGISLIQKIVEWTEASGKRCGSANRYAECLLTQTKGYIAKYRYIRDSWLPSVLALKP